ncbi:MAG: hypothetical protein EOM25_03245 [Deltaproteobacteria bacterium]|nr:hypothetical protein [Deltaproteobacteria bacterium]
MKKNLLLVVSALAVLGFLFITPAVSSDLNGETLAKGRCSTCHGFGRVEKAKSSKDRLAWEATVDRMIGKRQGLLNPDERLAVLFYLSGE